MEAEFRTDLRVIQCGNSVNSTKHTCVNNAALFYCLRFCIAVEYRHVFFTITFCKDCKVGANCNGLVNASCMQVIGKIDLEEKENKSSFLNLNGGVS